MHQPFVISPLGHNIELNIGKESTSTNIRRRVMCSNSAKPEVSSYSPGTVKIAANETVAVSESTTRRVLAVFFPCLLHLLYIIFIIFLISPNFFVQKKPEGWHF